MRLTKRLVQAAGLVAGVVGVVAATAPDSPLGRRARRVGRRLTRDVRYVAASTPGILYRLAGRRPDPYVTDAVLADRIRSTIGPLEKRLDVPRVHVMVDADVAVLHGEVPSDYEAHAVEHAVMQVSGVIGVESHLHPGLVAGDTRPSEGAAAPQPASDALRRADRHGTRCGRAADRGRRCTRCCAGSWTGCRPTKPCKCSRTCPPTSASSPVRRTATASARPALRTVPQLVAAVTTEGGIESRQAEQITRAVLATLRELVPEEAHDVAAVLPTELRELWNDVPGTIRAP